MPILCEIQKPSHYYEHHQGCRFPQIFQYPTTTLHTPIPNLRNMFCLVSYEHLIKASFLRKTLNYIKTLKIKIMHRWRSHQIAQRNHSLQNPSAVISCNGLSANHKTVYTGPVSAGANGKPVSAGRANGRAVLSGVGNYNIMPLFHACLLPSSGIHSCNVLYSVVLWTRWTP